MVWGWGGGEIGGQPPPPLKFLDQPFIALCLPYFMQLYIPWIGFPLETLTTATEDDCEVMEFTQFTSVPFRWLLTGLINNLDMRRVLY